MVQPHNTPSTPLLVTVNSLGRQSSSVLSVAAALGYRVRGQCRSRTNNPLLFDELSSLPNVELIEGSLQNPELIKQLFVGADIAYINTTSWGDELAIGKALADAAYAAGVKHLVYSSMTDHSVYTPNIAAIPNWKSKSLIEKHIRTICKTSPPGGMVPSFVYMGCYFENFSAWDIPLWGIVPDEFGGWTWTAPFWPEERLPFIDVEHDLGPAVMQIFKDGPMKWGGSRISLAFSQLTPLEICSAFSRVLNTNVTYIHSPILEVKVQLPSFYLEQLEHVVRVLGRKGAGKDYYPPNCSGSDVARQIWAGWRDIDEFIREVWVPTGGRP